MELFVGRGSESFALDFYEKFESRIGFYDGVCVLLNYNWMLFPSSTLGGLQRVWSVESLHLELSDLETEPP